MIANFYKVSENSAKKGVRCIALLASKNISCIPQKGTLIKFSGQVFTVIEVSLDIDACRYNLYVVRAHEPNRQ